MDLPALKLNLALGWLWIMLGFLSGAALGMRFHREDWLGGYGSFKRRLYRLGHISFFGLAILNLLFFFTFQSVNRETPGIQIASWAFAVGALTMPLCCLLVAHFPKWRPAFALPVLSLVAAGILTLNGILHL